MAIYYPGFKYAAIRQVYLDSRLIAGNDVVIGDDIAIRAPDDARTGAASTVAHLDNAWLQPVDDLYKRVREGIRQQ